jgi:hypothetical protein
MNVGKVWDNLLSVPLLVVLKPHSQTLDNAENTWRSTSGLVFVTFKWPGVENDLNNIRIFVQTSVFLTFSPHGTTLMALIRMSIYRCLQMLDGLVSSHPSMTTKKVLPLWRQKSEAIRFKCLLIHERIDTIRNHLDNGVTIRDRRDDFDVTFGGSTHSLGCAGGFDSCSASPEPFVEVSVQYKTCSDRHWRRHNRSQSKEPGNTKGGSFTVPLTSCLIGLESAVWQLTIFVFICKTD